MRLNWQDALQLLIAEQAAEAEIRSLPPGHYETVPIPAVILHVGGRRVELTGLQVRIPRSSGGTEERN